MNSPDSPPRLAAWLLERLRPQADAYALLGDFEEEFHYLLAEGGPLSARRWYWTQVLLSVPGFATQLIYWSFTMFINYVTIAGRQLVKNGRYTLINLVGLSVALACCIVAYLNYEFSYGFDAFHENSDQIYRVNSIRVVNDNPQEWGITPMPLGPAMKADLPFVRETVRFSETSAVVQRGEHVFNEQINFADAAFFDLFTFPLRYGTTDALRSPDQIVVSPETARKYFGEENPVGQSMIVRFDEEERLVVVGAVVEEIPLNSSIRFDILMPYETLVLFGDLQDWGRSGFVTFVEVSDAASTAGSHELFTDYLALQNTARPDWKIEQFFFVPLSEMHLASEDTRGYFLVPSMNPAAIVAPGVIAVLLLLMACFNFMNTAIAFAGRRFKEIGIRKVMGGLRRQLISQFMGESMLQCVVAFALALLLAEIFAPAYSSLWPYLDLQINYADNASLLFFLVGLLLATGLISGIYPAYYISGFSPVNILKGRQRLGGLNRFTRVLLTFQLTIAAMVILSSVVFTQNARFQETLDLGYDMNMVLMVPLNEPSDFPAFRDALAEHPDVLQVGGSTSHLNYSFGSRVAETRPTGFDEPVSGEIDVYFIGENYLETMGLTVVDGRTFLSDSGRDVNQSVMVNQTFARDFGLTQPVGETVVVDSTTYEVVGVFEDFYDATVWNPIDPAILRPTVPEQYRFLTVRVPAGRLHAVDTFLRATWQEMVPDRPYEGRFQDELLAEAILINRGIKTTFFYIAILAIVIAAAGLFGLMSLAIASRTKEIGIRKVLGATIANVGGLINREFIVMLLVASGIASVAGYFMTKMLLDTIWAYHSGVGILPPLLATLFMFVIAFATVGRQVYRIAASNPVHALRTE